MGADKKASARDGATPQAGACRAPLELPSNCGRNLIRLVFRCEEGSGAERVIYADAALRGQFWGPDGATDCAGELVESFNVVLRYVPLRHTELARLAERLAEWLEHPLELSVELGTEHREFRFRLGVEEGTLCSDEKPVARVSLALPHLRISSHYVVDQSCIRLFREVLAGWV